MKVSFKTFGCKLNQSETLKFKKDLLEKGVRVVPFDENPDIYVINACSVTQRAERKLRQEIYNARRQYPNIFLVVAGCFTKELKNNKKIKSLVDDWFPNEIKDSLPEALLNVYNFKKKKVKDISPETSQRNRSMVKIQDGCNQFCSYCIVPYLRNKLSSKSFEKIVKEINDLEKAGFKEINLVGANITLYNYKGNDLLDLLKHILENTSIPRIRISSLWPTFLNDEFIDLIAQSDRICPYIHLSVQSGCDKILKLMNRDYPLAQVKKVINKLKDKNIEIGTDIIVGFPGETESDFKKTYEFVKWAKFLNLHVFKYSVRPGTKAASFKNKVDSKVKNKRSKKLRKLGKKVAQNQIEKYCKQKIQARVLFESKTKNFWVGKTPNYIDVYLKSDNDLYNKIKKVNLTKPFKNGIISKKYDQANS